MSDATNVTKVLLYPLVWLLDFVSRKLGNRLIWGAPSERELRAIMARRDQRIMRYVFHRALRGAMALDKYFSVGYYQWPST